MLGAYAMGGAAVDKPCCVVAGRRDDGGLVYCDAWKRILTAAGDIDSGRVASSAL